MSKKPVSKYLNKMPGFIPCPKNTFSGGHNLKGNFASDFRAARKFSVFCHPVTTYYDEDYRLEIEARPENESTTEEDGERISESNENGSKKRERKEKRRVSFKDESVEENGQRDQDSFLEIDSRHDVWEQIRGLKAEIRTLEKELREEERRYGDRNQ